MASGKEQIERSYGPSSTPEVRRNEPESKEKQEIQKSAEGLAHSVEGIVEGAESGVESSGEVAEKQSEDKSKGPAGQMKKSGGTAANPPKFKPVAYPKIEAMRYQVASAIKHEIHALEKEAKRLKNSGNFDPFKLNSVVGKIRSLKDLLAHLTYATLDTIKNWWLKYVKGN